MYLFPGIVVAVSHGLVFVRGLEDGEDGRNEAQRANHFHLPAQGIRALGWNMEKKGSACVR